MTVLVPQSEIDRLCSGLRQNAAKVRYLVKMGYDVIVAPDGSPQIPIASWDAKHRTTRIESTTEPSVQNLRLLHRKAA